MNYLASPYTARTRGQMESRYRQVCIAARQLMEQGFVVYSPIAHSHSVAVDGQMARSLQTDHEFWLSQDLPVLKRCDRLFVLCIPGWDRSRGVAREIEFARDHCIPVDYLTPDDEGLLPVL